MGRKALCQKHCETLRPLLILILKILCQLLQTTPDAVTNTAWVYTLRCGDLAHTHTQVIPGINPLGLFLRQSHHRGIELLPQLLFLQILAVDWLGWFYY